MLRRCLIALCWLALCAPTFAAGEFQLLDKSLSGQTLYVLLFSGAGEADAGEAWDGDSWEPLTDTWSTFDVAMTEVSTTGNFLGTMPSIGNKAIRWVIYQDANDDATPDSAADIPLAEGYGYWATSIFGVPLTAAMTDATYVAEIAAGQGAISPLNIDKSDIWRFDNRNQITAVNNVIKAAGESTIYVGMDFTEPMPSLSSIFSVTSVEFTNVDGVTEPTVTASAKSADQKKVNITLDATSATTGTHTIIVTILTTDSQTFIRKGRLVLQ